MGGGGDGGFQAAQAEQERKKQAARNALNVYFGAAPGPGASLVNRADFTRSVPVSGDIESLGGGALTEIFDQAGYDAAVAAEAAQAGEAAKNKAALDALYGNVRQTAFDAGKRQLTDQAGLAGRDLKFELFARGLNGGSVDADQNSLLRRRTNDATLQLGAKADATAAQLRAGDEAARVGLLQSIDNGMDQGSAVSSALNQLRNNADKASAEAQGMNLGDLFSGAGLLYEQGRKAQGQQLAGQMWANYNGRPGGRGAPGGIVTRSDYGP